MFESTLLPLGSGSASVVTQVSAERRDYELLQLLTFAILQYVRVTAMC
jgi:hypothetical protein